MIDPQRLLSIGSPAERNIEIVERMMREDRPKMHPIKSEFQMTGSPEGYLAYTKSLQRLEQGRSIYDIKLDVPITLVAPEVLVGPARDGFAAHGFAQDDALEEMIGQFYRVHQKRFDNYFQKRRPTHAIFSRQAMEQFAQTGLESDHFFRHPPVQPGGARVAILTHLKAEQNETNPNFCLYFFMLGYRQPRTEICLYEGAGTMLTVAGYGLRPFRRALRVLITQTEFSRKYKAFFIHDLLEQGALARGDAEDVREIDRIEKLRKRGRFTQLLYKISRRQEKTAADSFIMGRRRQAEGTDMNKKNLGLIAAVHPADRRRRCC